METPPTPLSGLDSLGRALPPLWLILRRRRFDFPQPFFIGHFLFKFNLQEPSLYCQRGFWSTVEWVWREVQLSKITKIQKCPQKLLNNYIDVDVLCCDWDSDPPFMVERDIHFFAWNHITLSHGTAGPTSCFPLLRTDMSPDDRTAASAQTDRQYLLFHIYATFSIF